MLRKKIQQLAVIRLNSVFVQDETVEEEPGGIDSCILILADTSPDSVNQANSRLTLAGEVAAALFWL